MFAKKFLTAITSVVLCMTMLILSPIQIVASAAGNEQNKYISEVKVGMGETSELPFLRMTAAITPTSTRTRAQRAP